MTNKKHHLIIINFKRIFLFIFCFALIFNSFAIKPFGTKKIKINKETFYIDKVNLSNLDWAEYMVFAQLVDSITLEDITPINIDTLVWRKIDITIHLGETEYSGKVYHCYRNREKQPIVGITRQQAEKYCEWRSKIVNTHPKIKKTNKIVTYTLITEEQCEYLNKTQQFKKNKLSSNPFPDAGFRCIATIK